MKLRNEIYNGDCLEVMQGIPDNSIDMILADLPYGTTACAWDSIIPLDKLWPLYKRIIKDRGAVVLTGSQPFTTMLISSNLEWFKYTWIWEKKTTTNFLNVKKEPLRAFEDVLVFSPGSPFYNPILQKKAIQNVRANNIKRKQKSEVHNQDGVFLLNEFREIPVDKMYPKNILKFSARNVYKNRLHPTQKPVALFAYLIRTYTTPGDLVLDNTAGSGTTAIAAIDTGRDWLLIEKDPEYYQIARERIDKRLQQPFLISPNTAPNKPNEPDQKSGVQLGFAEKPK